jgi:hypothetical protein
MNIDHIYHCGISCWVKSCLFHSNPTILAYLHVWWLMSYIYIYIIYIYVYTIIINYILLYIVYIYIIYILYDNYHFTYLYLQNQGCRSKKPSIIRIQPLVLWPGLLLLFGVVWVQASWWIGLTSKLSIGFSVLFFSAIIGLTYRDSKRWLIELMKYVQKFTLINHNEPI